MQMSHSCNLHGHVWRIKCISLSDGSLVTLCAGGGKVVRLQNDCIRVTYWQVYFFKEYRALRIAILSLVFHDALVGSLRTESDVVAEHVLLVLHLDHLCFHFSIPMLHQ